MMRSRRETTPNEPPALRRRSSLAHGAPIEDRRREAGGSSRNLADRFLSLGIRFPILLPSDPAPVTTLRHSRHCASHDTAPVTTVFIEVSRPVGRGRRELL